MKNRFMFIKSSRLAIFIIFLFSNLTFALTPISFWKTKENAKVYYLYSPELPMLDIEISIDAGKKNEGKLYGLAELTADLLVTGADDLDEEQFTEALDNIGSGISTNSGFERTNISVRSLTDPEILNSTLSVLNKMLTKPRFEDSILQREIKNKLIDLDSIEEDPDSLAYNEFMKVLYPNHRLGISYQQVKQVIGSITTADISSFFNANYSANNAVIVLVGDIQRKDAEEISQKISELLSTAKSENSGKPVEYNKDNIQTVHLKFDSPQTSIILGNVSIKRSDPDYFALIVGNHILGGNSLNSILSKEIREKQGLTYGIYSGFQVQNYESPFIISYATKNESVDDSIQQVKMIVNNFIQNGSSQEELALAKNNLIGSLALKLDSNSKLANALLNLGIYDLPLDYYETYTKQIESITMTQIIEAFKKQIKPENFTVINVGGEVKTD